ncbi:Hsp70 protein [Desulfoluna spongiiphila]|uniref:Hsp70 protein n=2 Tax=Desulfoluna spongiiphila TaxID=419481 RepID=A0A1G5DA33_9BACT|nr:Hsp70 protein [Desulfoluna spongiiphila]
MEKVMSSYIVGIDLGTTNSVVAYTERPEDGAADASDIRLFRIPQLVDAGVVEKREMLPSFIFLPEAHDVGRGATALPWDAEPDAVVGEFARKRGGELPQRLISSAKSWLCNTMVDRKAENLPWKGPQEVSKMSAVTASAAILRHMRDAWNHEMAADDPALRLENQEIYLTVPASFDAVARELTVQAAALSGLAHVTLLEEPQAALYAWIESMGDDWRSKVKKGETLLVCDIGGGTSDFSLIGISEEDGELSLERIAVGDHLLVGGDNMDLALAWYVKSKMDAKGQKLDDWQMRGLGHSIRSVKEKILSGGTNGPEPVTILGRGSGLIGGTLKSEMDEKEVDQVILEGFLPLCSVGERPVQKRRSGLREMGLVYEQDPSISRHMAWFLARQGGDGWQNACIPDAVLFNGGIMKSAAVRERILGVVDYFREEVGNDTPVREVEAGDYDLSVARGAAYYGLARLGRGIRIRGGLSRSYYVSVEAAMPAIPGMPAPMKALCVAPMGMEEGTEERVASEEFVLYVGEPVAFDIMASASRRDDAPGDVIDSWADGEMEDLTSIETTLEGEWGTAIPVQFEIRVTEIGTLEFWCVATEGDKRWKLEFNVRERDDAGY